MGERRSLHQETRALTAWLAFPAVVLPPCLSMAFHAFTVSVIGEICECYQWNEWSKCAQCAVIWMCKWDGVPRGAS